MHSFLRSLSTVALGLAIVRAAPSVTIPAGTLQGTTCSNGASAFLSIPFAIPPVGSLRWTSPQAYNQTFPAEGYNATTKGAVCIQFGSEFTEKGATSEDCLYLDVWAPPNATSTSNLPVKVWIYGGGNQGGGIQNPMFDGCNLAAHDTLLVSINYRLGPIGFLTLASAGIAGNFGIQDLVLGLEWVQSYITAFGGNPKEVLLFGESAGASNTFLIATLPKATSLINAAIWESGAGPQLATSATANALGGNYATTLNCSTTDAACLRSVSTSVLQATAPEAPDAIIYSGLNPTDFQPHVDGVTVPEQPWSVGSKVPMMFGSNANEGGLFALGTYQSVEISEANYSIFLNDNFGHAASIVANQYPLTLPAFNSTGFPAFAAISTIITDAQFRCPAYQAMLKSQSNNIPVYTYLNSHIPSCQWTTDLPAIAIPFVNATHTSELPYVFGNGVGLPLPNGTCNISAQENAISETLIAAWSAMASTGNPSVQGLQWPRWNNNTGMGVNIVNATSVGVVDYSQCAFWDMIDNIYLNFTSSSANGTGNSGNGSGTGGNSSGSGTGNKNGGGRGIEMGVWGLTLGVGIAVSVLIG